MSAIPQHTRLFLVFAIYLLGSLCITPTAAAASTAGDVNDLLNQIDGIQPALTRPTGANSTQTEIAASPAGIAAPNGESPRVSWRRLLTLFAPALATAAALGISGSITGVFVLFRRESLFVLAMPQVVAVGAAIGLRLGWPTLPPALGAAAAALIYFVISKRLSSGHWVLPAFYVAGLSVSFLLIANKGQDVQDLQNLFVGIDVAVAPARAVLAVPILLLLAGLCAVLWRRWLLLAQAPAAAELAGLHPARWDALFLSILAAVILLGTDSLGVLMVLSMLFLPAAAALPWVSRIPGAMLLATLFSLLFLAMGFYLSNIYSWPFSQSVGGAGFATVVASHGLSQLLGKASRWSPRRGG